LNALGVDVALFFQPDFRSWPERSCDASSQKGAGDALVASCGSDYSAAGKNATGASLSPCGDEASPLLSAGRFGIRVQPRHTRQVWLQTACRNVAW
jgi:hypothetical protein